MTQTVDFRYEILFLLLVLVSLIGLVAAVISRVSGKGRAAVRLVKVLGGVWAVYLCIVGAVSARAREVAILAHQDLCYDEMCFSVDSLRTASQLGPADRPLRAKGTFYIVTVRVASHARGKPQAELGLRARLWSPDHQYAISQDGQAAWNAAHPENVPLTTRVSAGDHFLSDLVFDVDGSPAGLGVALSQGFTPGYLVIGESPLFHKPTILMLPRPVKAE